MFRGNYVEGDISGRDFYRYDFNWGSTFPSLYSSNAAEYSLYSAGPDMVDSRGVAKGNDAGSPGDIVLNP